MQLNATAFCLYPQTLLFDLSDGRVRGATETGVSWEGRWCTTGIDWDGWRWRS